MINKHSLGLEPRKPIRVNHNINININNNNNNNNRNKNKIWIQLV